MNNMMIKLWLLPLYFFGFIGAFFIMALIWAAPIQFGFIQSGYTAASQVPDVSSLWVRSNIPIFIVTIACSIGMAFRMLNN